MKSWRRKNKPDFYNGDSDSDEGEQYWDSSVRYHLLHDILTCLEINSQNIRKTVVTLQPELKISLERGFNDQGKTNWNQSFERQKK